MSVVEAGAFSGESSFFPGTAGITPLALKLILETPTKNHRQGTDRKSIKANSFKTLVLKRNQTTVHFAEPWCYIAKAGSEGRLRSISLSGLTQRVDIFLVGIPVFSTC